jgi:hypothetical protein
MVSINTKSNSIRRPDFIESEDPIVGSTPPASKQCLMVNIYGPNYGKLTSMRLFRDTFLKRFFTGRCFIFSYYMFSRKVIPLCEVHNSLRRFMNCILDLGVWHFSTISKICKPQLWKKF